MPSYADGYVKSERTVDLHRLLRRLELRARLGLNRFEQVAHVLRTSARTCKHAR